MTVRWRKSTSSGANTSCVEVANNLDAVRDSKNPTGPILTFGQDQLTAFLTNVKSGRFDS